MKTVNLELVKTALDKASGIQFENFANAAFAELIGSDFIPLGGYQDWGADALLSGVTGSKRPSVFYQFSVENDFRGKIRRTVERLREVGRDVKTIYYATSVVIPRIDIVENELGDALEVMVRIRDGGYLANQVNTSPALLEAYHTYLAPSVSYLNDLQTNPLLPDNDANVNSSIYVFLRNELESRETGGPAEGLADGLIIWALRDTDPDRGKFLTGTQIVEQIDKDVPGVSSILKGIIPNRLNALSRISRSEQRPIKFHAKEKKYCLAFDLRKKMQGENLQAETLKRTVFNVYRNRVLDCFPDVKENFIETASSIALRTIQCCLEKEGLEFAMFLSGKSEEKFTVQQWIEECLREEEIARQDYSNMHKAVECILYGALNSPDKEETLFYSRIASVYTILFCLRTEPKLIQYFQRMAGRFQFYIGSDVLVQVLSERFVPNERQIFTKTLRLVKAAGGTIILTEPVLDEVQHHICVADQEFKSHYLDGEEAITPDNLDIVTKPLIRSYFQGKFLKLKESPNNWPQFINNYCNPRAIYSEAAKEELRKYLMTKIVMQYQSLQEIEVMCKDRNVRKLATLLEPHKKKKELAYNDALMVYLVYARRKENSEADDISEYGLRTWWLTNEVAVTEYTKQLVNEEGQKYLMRPDFLLNFLTLIPKKNEVKNIFNTLFPSLLGVHLARDYSPSHVKRLHEYLAEFKSVDPARQRVLVAQKSDELKADLRSASWSKLFARSDR